MAQRLLNRFFSLFLASLLLLGAFNSWAEEETLKEELLFAWPLKGEVTKEFGLMPHPIWRRRRMHAGLDIAARLGTPVKAMADGEVIQVKWRGGYGRVVVIDHGMYQSGNYTTLYARLSNPLVKVGDFVKKGDIIGKVGNLGGPSLLHFEVRVFDEPVNPRRYPPVLD